MSIEFSVMHTPENISKVTVETDDMDYYTHGVVVFTPDDERKNILLKVLEIDRLMLANMDRALVDGTVRVVDGVQYIGGLRAESREALEQDYDNVLTGMRYGLGLLEGTPDLYQVVGWARSEEEASQIELREVEQLEWDDTFRTVYPQPVLAVELGE